MAQPQGASSVQEAPAPADCDKEVLVPWYYKLMVGGAAGIIGTSVIFPMDTVKTRMMRGSEPRNLLSISWRCSAPRAL